MKKIIIIIIALASGVFQSCKPDEVIEVKQTSDPVEALITAVNEVYSTFDVLDDYMSSEVLVKKKEELLIPNSVLISFLDMTFLDGDGIEFTLDFGPLGPEAPFGVLCKDQKYRAGIIHVSMSDYYSNPETRVVVSLDPDQAFYSGNGNEMYKLTGKLEVVKNGLNSISIKTSGIEVYVEDEPVVFVCDNTIIKTKDPGSGIMNDEIEIAGNFEISTVDGTNYKAIITESLKKIYEPNCVKNIIKGIIELNAQNTSSQLSADFDPYQDQACDNLVEITINGKSSIYQF